MDGDKSLLVIGKKLKESGELVGNVVVGTTMTNMGIEKAFEKLGIDFIREDVGDKYILRRLLKDGGVLGGEGSGHTLILGESTTGDGVQTALVLAKIMKSKKAKLSKLAKVDIYPQIIQSIEVADKKIIEKENIIKEVELQAASLEGEGRVVLRASGTENKVRVMAEGKNSAKILSIVKSLTKSIEDENKYI